MILTTAVLLLLSCMHTSSLSNNGNVRVSYASELNPAIQTEDLFFCPDSYHYFRCDIIECSHLTWMINGNEVQTLFTSDSTTDDFPHDPLNNKPLNILVQSIQLGEREHETNFTSYLWFNSGLYPGDGPSEVTVSCKSDKHLLDIHMKAPGVITTPSVTVSASYNESIDHMIVQCRWDYSGDSSIVAFFDLEVKNGNNVMVHQIALNNIREETLKIPYDTNGHYSAVLTVVDHCNNRLPTTLMFQPERISAGNSSLSLGNNQECPGGEIPDKELSTGAAIAIGFIVGAVCTFLLLLMCIICAILLKRYRCCIGRDRVVNDKESSSSSTDVPSVKCNGQENV